MVTRTPADFFTLAIKDDCVQAAIDKIDGQRSAQRGLDLYPSVCVALAILAAPNWLICLHSKARCVTRGDARGVKRSWRT